MKKSFLQKINKTLASIMLLGLPLTNSVQLIHALENEVPIVQDGYSQVDELISKQEEKVTHKADSLEFLSESEETDQAIDAGEINSEVAVKKIEETAVSDDEIEEISIPTEEDSNDSLIEEENGQTELNDSSSYTYSTELENYLSNQLSIEDQVAEFTLEDYKKASAVEMAKLIKEGVTTPEQLLKYAFEMIELTNPELKNVITLRKELALEELAAMEDTDLPFYGVPLLVKGLGHTVAGGSNTNGVEYLKDQISTRTGNYVRKLQEAGFVVIGQTSYPQMGWINVTNSDLYGNTHNPWNLDYNPGGSSGGSSAAVAVGQVPIATTSDAGGSTRIPASFSSLIGLHPSRGILEGNSNSANSQTSHFAIMRDMEDLNQLFDVLLKDSFVEEVNDPSIQLSKTQPIAYTYNTPAGTPIDIEAIQAVRNAVEFLKSQGYTLVEVDYPVDGKAMMYDYYTIAAGGASSLSLSASRILGRPLEKDDVELLTWALYQTGQELTGDHNAMARSNIAQMTETLAAFYEQYPVLLTAATAYPAPAADYNHIPEELVSLMADMSNLTIEEKMDLIYEQWLPAWTKTPYTQLSNLTGTPSLSLPTHLTADGLPLGVMFNSALYQDRLLLQIGDLFNNHNLLISYYRTENELERTISPYQVQYKFTVELPKGKTQVLVPGKAGEMISLYAVEYEGTQEVGRQLLDQTRTNPVTEIVLIGTKVEKVEEPSDENNNNNQDHDTDNKPNENTDSTVNPDLDPLNDEDLMEEDLPQSKTDSEEERLNEENKPEQEITGLYLPVVGSLAQASLMINNESSPLFDSTKRQALNDFMLSLGEELNQKFIGFTPENPGEMLGLTFPNEVLKRLAINGREVKAYWSENGQSIKAGDYAVIAAYHNNSNYYLFVLVDGEPLALESQQTEIHEDGLIYFQPTNNEVLQNGFENIVSTAITVL